MMVANGTSMERFLQQISCDFDEKNQSLLHSHNFRRRSAPLFLYGEG